MVQEFKVDPRIQSNQTSTSTEHGDQLDKLAINAETNGDQSLRLAGAVDAAATSNVPSMEALPTQKYTRSAHEFGVQQLILERIQDLFSGIPVDKRKDTDISVDIESKVSNKETKKFLEEGGVENPTREQISIGRDTLAVLESDRIHSIVDRGLSRIEGIGDLSRVEYRFHNQPGTGDSGLNIDVSGEREFKDRTLSVGASRHGAILGLEVPLSRERGISGNININGQHLEAGVRADLGLENTLLASPLGSIPGSDRVRTYGGLSAVIGRNDVMAESVNAEIGMKVIDVISNAHIRIGAAFTVFGENTSAVKATLEIPIRIGQKRGEE